MKIEIGESLFYSWLRHIKECQVVQTNWKTSSSWLLQNDDELQKIISITDEFFKNKYNYSIYKKNSSLSQLLQQSEIDVLGIHFDNEKTQIYSVDVAFHKAGLNYGSNNETIERVLKKCLRSAMCIYGYFNKKSGEIVFASPKINTAVLNNLKPCFDDMKTIMQNLGFDFNFRIIANDDFSSSVLEPILQVSSDVSDTAELFMRSYKMLQMFEIKRKPKTLKDKNKDQNKENFIIRKDDYKELKVGQIARFIMMDVLQSGVVEADEISRLQNKTYSKENLGLDYPALVKIDDTFDNVRYYKNVLLINGLRYRLCSQWFEVPANDDRGYLLDWLKKYDKREEK
ncbi:hypothetical protein [Campylobacter majalis]|uniref:hypothetical protein n=1 Tax=Campylobacter majalis TaxID=2790656 RepID=UPI003D69A0A8